MQRFLFLLLLCVPLLSWAQETDVNTDTLQLPDFRGIRVFKTLNGALQHPDSVFRLDLSKQKLKEVPEEIRKFPNLKELNLSKNNISELPELESRAEKWKIILSKMLPVSLKKSA